MKLGITGLPQSGKSTIFSALTGSRGEDPTQKPSKTDARIGTVRVVDERMEVLARMVKPKKTTSAQVEYLLPSEMGASESARLNQVRICDALIHVVRNFEAPGGLLPSPEEDFWRHEEEMILSDLVVVEKRMERIETERRKGQKPHEEESSLIHTCKAVLEDNRPLRTDVQLATAPRLRGFTFLSAKPQLVIVNNDDEDESMPPWDRTPERVEMMVVRGRLEMDIATMSSEEAQEFLEAYHIEQSALDRVIRTSYAILNRISFFTIVNQEIRAWTIPAGTPAVKAAGAVHSDMEKGFIRAETVSFEDLETHGSFQEAKKAGVVRLEGKDYEVRDGDVINFRFNI
jgi:GTP-binding protein YchF